MFGYQGGNFQVRIHCKYCTALQQLTYTSSTLHSSVKIKRKAESRALVLPVPFSTHSRGQTIQEHERDRSHRVPGPSWLPTPPTSPCQPTQAPRED